MSDITKELLIRAEEELRRFSLGVEDTTQVKYCLTIINSMAKDYPTWEENCPFTSNIYREELKEKLNSIISINPPWRERELDRITFILSLYLKERTATQQRKKHPLMTPQEVY